MTRWALSTLPHVGGNTLRNSSTAKLSCTPEVGTWSIVRERELLRTNRGVSVTEQAVHLPDGTLVPDYLQIKMPSHTTVLALTLDGLAICIRQYKHGVGRVALTLPGGFIEQGESPLETAKRELLEETGYQCTEWQQIGSFVVGANQGIGSAYLFLAKGGSQVAKANSGDLEDMETELVTLEQLSTDLMSGKFPVLSHTCAIALAVHQL